MRQFKSPKLRLQLTLHDIEWKSSHSCWCRIVSGWLRSRRCSKARLCRRKAVSKPEDRNFCFLTKASKFCRAQKSLSPQHWSTDTAPFLKNMQGGSSSSFSTSFDRRRVCARRSTSVLLNPVNSDTRMVNLTLCNFPPLNRILSH